MQSNTGETNKVDLGKHLHGDGIHPFNTGNDMRHTIPKVKQALRRIIELVQGLVY